MYGTLTDNDKYFNTWFYLNWNYCDEVDLLLETYVFKPGKDM